MKIWMAIGYTDYEGDSECDKAFVHKDKAVDHILNFLADIWTYRYYDREKHEAVDGKICNRYEREEFISKTKEYINKHPEITYWYFWAGADYWKEIFEDWRNTESPWIALELVDLDETI